MCSFLLIGVLSTVSALTIVMLGRFLKKIEIQLPFVPVLATASMLLLFFSTLLLFKAKDTGFVSAGCGKNNIEIACLKR